MAKWAFGVMDRLPALAEELVQLKPDVIVAAPTPAVAALHTKTESIPIVSFMLADEVRLGLVASSARPGGNVTGLSMRLDGMVGKQLELAQRSSFPQRRSPAFYSIQQVPILRTNWPRPRQRAPR